MDENGNIQDLEQELLTLKSIDTSHSDAAAQSTQNTFSSAGDAKTYARNASKSANAANTSVGDAQTYATNASKSAIVASTRLQTVKDVIYFVSDCKTCAMLVMLLLVLLQQNNQLMYQLKVR